MDIGGYLKFFREKNKFTQEYVASQLNISRQAVSAWENDLAYPDLENLILLSRLYKTSLDGVVGNKMNMENKDDSLQVHIHLLGDLDDLDRILLGKKKP